MTAGWIVSLPAGYRPDPRWTLFQCGANARLHWAVRARVTAQIRADSAMIARARRLPRFTVPVAILAVQHPAAGRRALDVENISPLVKAMIDGLRDAGVLINDSPAYVTAVTFAIGERVVGGQLSLTISPVGGTDGP